MLSCNFIVLVVAIVGSSAAVLVPRNDTSNDCAQAVAGSESESAKADCASNVISYTVITVTITPVAFTLTETSGVQETALATTISTATESTTGTSYVTSTETDQEFSTVYSTATETITLTIPVVYTPPVVTTTTRISVTSTSVSTITSYYPTASPVGSPVKRNLLQEARDLEAREDDDEVCEISVEEVWVADLPESTSSMLPKPTSSAPYYALNTTSPSTAKPTSSAPLFTLNSPSTASAIPTSLVPVYANSTSSFPTYSNSTSLVPDTATSTSPISDTPTSTLSFEYISTPTSPIGVTPAPTLSMSFTPTSSIPLYASACTSWAEYVTACSSIGYSQMTSVVSLILPADTVTVYVQSTQTTTLVKTSSAAAYQKFTTFQTLATSTTKISTVTVPVLATSLLTVYQTSTAIASTAYIYQTVTVTASSVSLQTVTALVPNFKLQMVPASGTGPTYYMTTAVGNGLAYKNTTDFELASNFTLDTKNRLVTIAENPQIACAVISTNKTTSYYYYGLQHIYLDKYPNNFTALACAVNSDFTLSCAFNTSTSITFYAKESSFFYSISNYANLPNYIARLVGVA